MNARDRKNLKFSLSRYLQARCLNFRARATSLPYIVSMSKSLAGLSALSSMGPGKPASCPGTMKGSFANIATG